MGSVAQTSAGLFLAAWMASFPASAAEIDVELSSGSKEVPPVQTMASGTARFVVKDDMTVSGDVKTTGIDGIAAHIHEGAAGQNGAVVIPLTKKGGDEWIVPAGAKLSAAQMTALKAGNLYVNVHSDAYKSGEIRGQLKE